jgi:hypothetical protein
VPRSKNEWSYTSTPQYVFMAWCLVEKREEQRKRDKTREEKEKAQVQLYLFQHRLDISVRSNVELT